MGMKELTAGIVFVVGSGRDVDDDIVRRQAGSVEV
jgi:hypothetical protein